MTVRIGTGSASVDPSALRVAGAAPSKIMLGTGSAAVQVWSADPLTHWARFDASALTANSGSAGGAFSQVGTVAARTPGAWIPAGSCLHSPVGGLAQGFTLATWFKTTKSGSGTDGIVGVSAGADSTYVSHSRPSGSLTAAVSIGGKTIGLAPSPIVPPSAWAHTVLAVWPDGSTPGKWHAQLFLNGASVAYSSVSGATAPSGSPATLVIGGVTPDASGSPWEGDIDESRLYLTPLNATQVKAVFDAEKSAYGLLQGFTAGSSTTFNLPNSSWTTIHTHTVTGRGAGTIAANWTSGTDSVSTRRWVRLMLNGTQVWYGEAPANGAWNGSLSLPDTSLGPGDALTLEAYAGNITASNRAFGPWAFSLTPN